MEVLLGIIFWVVGLWVLYCVIKAAIDNSETARNIKILTTKLNRAFPDIENAKPKDYQEFDISIDKCPGCGTKISETDELCSSCGLRIIKEDSF